jgi:simple sugar transport system permease protein
VSAFALAAGPLGELRARATWPEARRLAGRALFWLGMYVAALVIFGAFVSLRHVNPVDMYRSMWTSTLTGTYGPGQVLDRAAPFILAAFAVAVPARAGLFNIGGEGQLMIGATAAGGVMLALGPHGDTFISLLLMGLAAAAAGAAWAGIAGVLRLKGRVDEAISTLLLNYVAADVLNYFVYGPWKDPSGNGQPVGKMLSEHQTMPTWHLYNSHISILVALVAVVIVSIVLWRTKWGFSLRCIGGNPEATRRAGLKVGVLMLSAMLVGGALAGLAGMMQYTSLEGQLRPGLGATFGYTAFLASWLARHQPTKVVFAALLLAIIAVAGDSLQLNSGLPGSTVNVLTAVVLLVVLSYRRTLRKAS